jgi:hypothetical protein
MKMSNHFSLATRSLALIGVIALLMIPTVSAASFGNSRSIAFDSDYGQYLSIKDADQTGLDLNGTYTFEMWVKFERHANQTLIAKRLPPNQRGYSFAVLADPGPEISRVRVTNSSTGMDLGYADVAWSPSLFTWYHVAVVIENGANRIELFVNGISQGTGSGILSSTYNNSAEFRIGNDDNVSFTDGNVDEVRVWSVRRTDTEIRNNMTTVLSGSEPGLVGYWRFEDNLLDETSNNNDLTNINGATFSPDVPLPIPTLSEAGLLLVALLLAVAGALVIRRRRSVRLT